MGHGRGKSAGSKPPPPPPVADYNVTGELTPDATCNYFYKGEFWGKPYYHRNDEWFIWWNNFLSSWFISQEKGIVGLKYWQRNNPEITGEYQPSPSVAGIATVAAGGH